MPQCDTLSAKDQFPEDRARNAGFKVTPRHPALRIRIFGNRDPRGPDNTIRVWLDDQDRLHIQVQKPTLRCYTLEQVIETPGAIEVVQR